MAEPHPARRPRARDSRSLLEASARTEFAEFGFAGARVDRIARRAGVNKQLLFYYFGSKRRLYESVVSGMVGGGTETTSSRLGARHAAEIFRDAFRSVFDALSRGADLAWILVSEMEQTGPARSAYGRRIRQHIDELRQVIVEGQRHGYFRDDADPDMTARQAIILALGYVILAGVVEREADATRARTWRDATADLLVRALAW